MPQSPPVAEHAVLIRVTVPESILSQYEDQADSRPGRTTVEAVAAERLTRCVDHDDSKPLYFSDDERRELEQILGRNVLHTKDALLQIRNAMSVRVNKTQVPLKQNLLVKLKSRCIGMEFDAFIIQRITQALEQYVGMR